ncbi:unnamed protein product [Medioppia subpectinata]|uniref:G-protein coupled receptors family 1 profile domain-containing protein n=1 Tax=Medioppia subpectinata TaxID=1979941 RepID=A0A7R9QBY4_9ACAR|nr:unnamed protein product [Medioppia subpectinata]CAG2117464.1 unnamed protein product [Medioppia subpectinata]
MLSTVVILFGVCWLPIHIFSMLVYFYPQILNAKTKVAYNVYVGTYFFCHWISQFHSLVNPIVYCFMSENFRNSLRSLIQSCFTRIKTCDRREEWEVNITQDQSLSSYNNSNALRVTEYNNKNRILDEDFL